MSNIWTAEAKEGSRGCGYCSFNAKVSFLTCISCVGCNIDSLTNDLLILFADQLSSLL
jgi:hypothetical protein